MSQINVFCHKFCIFTCLWIYSTTCGRAFLKTFLWFVKKHVFCLNWPCTFHIWCCHRIACDVDWEWMTSTYGFSSVFLFVLTWPPSLGLGTMYVRIKMGSASPDQSSGVSSSSFEIFTSQQFPTLNWSRVWTWERLRSRKRWAIYDAMCLTRVALAFEISRQLRDSYPGHCGLDHE